MSRCRRRVTDLRASQHHRQRCRRSDRESADPRRLASRFDHACHAEERARRDGDRHADQRRTRTGVRAAPERHMPRGVAADVKPAWLRKLRRVVVRRREQQDHAITRADTRAADHHLGDRAPEDRAGGAGTPTS